jgi:cell division protein FtsB
MTKAKPKDEAQVRTRTLISQRMSWLVWAILASMAVLLLSAFSRAWETNQALKAEIAALEPLVAASIGEQTSLEARLTYVKSDEYVEAWSQTQAGMARSGETLVIPVDVTPVPQPTPQVIEVPLPAPTAESFWSTLWGSLTGD